MEAPYKKSLDDEIDWKIIDQLHAATVTFSSMSLELKKLFFVLVGIAVPTLIKLSAGRLDISLFITLYVLIIAFWFLDSFTYYYQEVLRERMNSHFGKIRRRNSDQLFVYDDKPLSLTMSSERTSERRVLRSVFNTSVSFYFVLLFVNTIGFFLFVEKII